MAVVSTVFSVLLVGVTTTSTASAWEANWVRPHWTKWGQPCGKNVCLYYYKGLWGGSWRPNGTADADLAGNRFYDSGHFGSAGAGQTVRNNASSMGNRSMQCRLDVFVFTNYRGDRNQADSGWAGDLLEGVGFDIPRLRNNNASIKLTNC